MGPRLEETDYPRSRCRIGIVHLGFGAFHRAHLAEYIDEYMQASGDLRWGICAVNLRAADSEGFEVFRRSSKGHASKGYVLKTMDPDGGTGFRKVRSHLDFRDWSVDPEYAEESVSSKDVHIISSTVSESGYCLDKDGGLDEEHPAIRSETSGGEKRTIYAFLAAALGRRMRAKGGPITVLCCDNIRGNGDMLRENLMRYLEMAGERESAQWIRANARFPNAMVDRITPKTTPELVLECTEAFDEAGYHPIHAESFKQWVLEDRFAGPFPDLNRVEVEIVPSVAAFEETKIRVLNGAHTALCYFGALDGYDRFDEVMRDPIHAAHFRNFIDREVLPGLPDDLPFDRKAYRDRIEERFGNRAIGDRLERICADGYAKFPIFVMPTVVDAFDRGHLPEHAIASIAAWYHFARRSLAGKSHIAYHEPNLASLAPLLDDARDFAAAPGLWGDIGQRHPEFATCLQSAIEKTEKRWPI
ncbi:mannitol dehydrogenase family protein [Thioalkalivibrio sp. HK1]|uniref:mannitol dehydrogenase family protein n=1 Tax=Thioalkalivibrio sp. HK1 TaxID=1469245 RepID=UPI000472CA5A|nr:mannitol dehydrogenase family protein [Thioalkalivibrio sp. HK1]